MSELEVYTPPSIEALWRYANAYSISKMFPDIQSAEQAFVKISAGAEMGLAPFQSMNGIDVIKGRPVLKPALLRGLLDNHADYDYEVTWEPDACTVTIFKDGKKRGDSRFSMEDAKKAGLAGKENYQKFERNMLLERATSNGVRWYAPGLTMGPAYVEGEITADVEAIIPEGVMAKPRTRVTAEVVPTEPEEKVEDDEVELDYEPATLGTVSEQLRALSQQERADLYSLVGIEKGTKASDVSAILTAKADEWGLAYSDPPHVHAILERARIVRREEMPDDAVDAFDHFAQTGQDLSDDPQTALA